MSEERLFGGKGGRSMARLIVVDPAGGRREVALASLPLRIGRQADNEIVLRDTRVSRLQAQITAAGQKITQHTLCAGDEIEFGVPNSYRVIYAAEGATITEIVERIEARAPQEAGPRELHHLGVLLDLARSLGAGLSLQDVLATVLDAAI
jgi:hypothetical protein